MAIQYTNRRGQTYYLHQGTTKTSKANYFFSMKSEGKLVDAIPDGFEIHENPNAQVFLRRKPPKIITDEEVALVDQGMRQYSNVDYYQIDVRKDTITVYVADQGLDLSTTLFGAFPLDKVRDGLRRYASYMALLQFVLTDKEKRVFRTRRYCFLGSIDNWIGIGEPGKLSKLVKEYAKHLGEDSFYELF